MIKRQELLNHNNPIYNWTNVHAQRIHTRQLGYRFSTTLILILSIAVRHAFNSCLFNYKLDYNRISYKTLIQNIHTTSPFGFSANFLQSNHWCFLSAAIMRKVLSGANFLQSNHWCFLWAAIMRKILSSCLSYAQNYAVQWRTNADLLLNPQSINSKVFVL